MIQNRKQNRYVNFRKDKNTLISRKEEIQMKNLTNIKKTHSNAERVMTITRSSASKYYYLSSSSTHLFVNMSV